VVPVVTDDPKVSGVFAADREVVANFGPVMDVEVLDGEGRTLPIRAIGRLSHGPQAGRLIVCVGEHSDEPDGAVG
jgi:hypothetical protein